jgi:putative endonuclease
MKPSKKLIAWQRGLWGETLSVAWLRLRGYRILHRRWRYQGGEIDIIALKKKSIRIIEVKYRHGEATVGWDAMTPQKWRRLSRGAELFQARYKRFASYEIQFDVILVSSWQWPKHFQNVWYQERKI